jgi:hypothetical protein
MAGVLTETFTAANGTAITARPSDSGHTWGGHPSGSSTFTIHNNRAYCSLGINNLAMSSALAQTADVQATYTFRYLSGDGSLGILLRLHPTAATFYMSRLNSANQWQIYKFVNGSATLLGSYSQSSSPPEDHTCIFDITGNVLTLTIGGTLRITANDSDAALANTRGVGLRDSSVTTTTGKHLDSLVVTDAAIAASSASVPVLRIGQYRVGPLRVGKD